MMALKRFLDQQARLYNQPEFIEQDPVSIPHRFTQQQDIEIAGFFAAILAWGSRKSIIHSCLRLLEYMDNAPYDFILHHQPKDFAPMRSFAHRTFNAIDLEYFLFFLQTHYRQFSTLEYAFSQFMHEDSPTVEPALKGFYTYFFALEAAPDRTRKHMASPERGSACKRLNMYLRWMVRNDGIVDFGLWESLRPAQLVCPLDVHVGTVARQLGLLDRKQNDWKSALALTAIFKQWNSADPVIYDFALFSLVVTKKRP